MADWDQIKADYIASGSSYKQLAAKYGVHRTQVERHGKKEGWVELRRQHAGEVLANALGEITADQTQRLVKILSVSDDLLLKVEQMLKEDGDLMDTQALRHIAAILKDVKDIQMIRSEADMREQEARIDKLRADAERVEKNAPSNVTVVLEGEVADYGG